MRHAIAPRKEIGIRTVFNILGPLTNPADAKKQLLGVSESYLTELMAAALLKLGSERAIIAHGMDGIDELTTVAETQITELKDGKLSTYTISPEDVGLSTARKEDISISGGTEESAKIVTAILDGEQGPRRDIVLLNAGAALFVTDKASSLKDGIAKAAEIIEGGKARDVLHGLIKLSRRLGGK
jgi:anthranilate phosphoribosyltransferase